MSIGTVKWFNGLKRVIQPSNREKDMFVHASAVERSGVTRLVEGKPVCELQRDGRTRKECAVNLGGA